MIPQRPFPYLQSFYFALSSLIDHFSIFFLLSLVWIAIFFGSNLLFLPLGWYLIQNPKLLSFTFLFEMTGAFFLLKTCLIILFQYQLLTAAIAIYKMKPITLTELFIINPAILAKFFVTRFLYLLVCALLSILLIFPGLYVATKYYFVGFSVLSNDTPSIKKDIDHAQQLSQGLQWQLLFVLLVHSSVITLLYIPLGFYVADIFLLPLTALTEAHLYYTLKASSKETLSTQL